jgi:hypothetical protein
MLVSTAKLLQLSFLKCYEIKTFSFEKNSSLAGESAERSKNFFGVNAIPWLIVSLVHNLRNTMGPSINNAFAPTVAMRGGLLLGSPTYTLMSLRFAFLQNNCLVYLQ